MKLPILLLAVLVSSTQLPPKEGAVASVREAKADFSKLTTYSWERGQEAFDRKAHAAIVAAIDGQMKALGFRQVLAGKADVTVRYFSALRTDVDLDELEKWEREGNVAPARNLGRLAVVMRDGSNRRLWAADTVQPLSSELPKAYEEISPVVAKLFATYPGAKK
jgi:hypothetical protein